MVKRRSKSSLSRPLGSQRRSQASIAGLLTSVNRRAHEQANRKSGKRGLKFVRAAIAADSGAEETESAEWPRRLLRWTIALLLLPICWVTTWTFLSRFSHATVHQGFWQTAEFWYFATGVLLMLGWFVSGLLKSFFLYLYVLGHELTHAIFVVMFRGKVTDFHVSVDGGYITTNKTNLVIALSPYFVPFWAVVAVPFYVTARHFADLPPVWDRGLYAVLGITWTFHFMWTLWMIPRDQPDLKDNGTFLSLVFIYLANLLVLVALFCVAAEAPLESFSGFGREWLRHAATWGDVALRMTEEGIGGVRKFWLF